MKLIIVFFFVVCLCCFRNMFVLWFLVQEIMLSVGDLIWLVFVCEGENIEEFVFFMSGVVCCLVDWIVEVVKEVVDLGIFVICFFFYIEGDKCMLDCVEVWNFENFFNCVICVIKEVVLEIVIMMDVVFDFYSDIGQDGFVIDGYVVNDEIIEVFVKQVFSQVEVGVDIIGLLDMMDGCIGVLCSVLEGVGYKDVVLMFYFVKYVSVFYGFFRDVVGVLGVLKGDKKIY